MADAIKNKYNFKFIFDVEYGNPNGDPDAANLPRMDPMSSTGLVSPVSMKHKMRNYVIRYADNVATAEEADKLRIMMRKGKVINKKLEDAYGENKIKPKGDKNTKEEKNQVAEWLLEHYWDIRTFGMVANTGNATAGIMQGPVAIGFARSVDEIEPTSMTITRCLRTKEDKAEADNAIGKITYIPYGLYVAEGYIDAINAEKTHFSEDDLKLLWESLLNMFENDIAAARGKITLRKLIVFKHENKMGNASTSMLFDKVKVERVDETVTPRKYSDYVVTVDKTEVPGVEIIEML